MLEEYFLLVRRIQDIGLSIDQYWEMDTWTTSKLYCMELDLIDEEERQFSESEDDRQDSSDMRDLYSEMYGDE